MQRLNNAIHKLEELSKISGKNDKISFIKANEEDKDFIELLIYRLHPFYQYNIRKIQEDLRKEPSTNYEELITLLELLKSSNINNTLRSLVADFVARTDHTISYTIEGIITKSFNLGVSAKSVNKALGYTLIPDFACMLAQPLRENTKIPDKVIIEKKYDGVRCLVLIKNNKCTLLTRKGRELIFPQLHTEFIKFANNEDLVIDCELLTESRTAVSGICNTNLKTGYVEAADDILIAEMFDIMPYHIFMQQGETKIQSERTYELQRRYLDYSGHKLQLGESYEVSSKDIPAIAKKFIDAGDEGVIVKDPNETYQFKRSNAWLKVKAVNQTSLKVVGTDEGKGKRKGKVGALLCETSCGRLKVKVGSGLSDDEVELFTKTPPIGKIVEVYFNVVIRGTGEETYSLFLPRFRSGDIIRVDKDEADSFEKLMGGHIGKPEI